jgi:hypothetical protein
MQDQWIGDDGDMLKLALLRHLIAHGGDLVRPLGVQWYYRPTESDVPPLRAIDPELFDALDQLRDAPGRSVAALERADLLPGAIYFTEPLDYPKGLRQSGRRELRGSWHRRARVALEACPTVFLDPDNGVEPDMGDKSYDKNRLAHVLWAELQDWYEAGKTVVVFQHARRVADLQHQLAEQIKDQLGLDRLPLVVRHKTRWLYVIPAADTWLRFSRMVEEFNERWRVAAGG